MCKTYKNRKCRTKVNSPYRIMQSDIHNLSPAIGELNTDKKNLNLIGKHKLDGACTFNVFFKQKNSPLALTI